MCLPLPVKIFNSARPLRPCSSSTYSLLLGWWPFWWDQSTRDTTRRPDPRRGGIFCWVRRRIEKEKGRCGWLLARPRRRRDQLMCEQLASLASACTAATTTPGFPLPVPRHNGAACTTGTLRACRRPFTWLGHRPCTHPPAGTGEPPTIT